MIASSDAPMAQGQRLASGYPVPAFPVRDAHKGRSQHLFPPLRERGESGVNTARQYTAALLKSYLVPLRRMLASAF